MSDRVDTKDDFGRDMERAYGGMVAWLLIIGSLAGIGLVYVWEHLHIAITWR